MDRENNELKRCPFCGTVVAVFQDTISGRYGIRCLEFKCGALVFFNRAVHSMEETQERWNRRVCKDAD